MANPLETKSEILEGANLGANAQKGNANKDSRATRTQETRVAEMRTEGWKEPSKLPDPEPQDGYVYRWIRTATLGQADPTNVSLRFREGWVPVPLEEVQHLGLMPDHRSRFPKNLEVGGLLLCKMEASIAEQRQKHYEKVSRTQIEASDHNFMKQADPRMPVLTPSRSSTVTFGQGRPTK